MNSKLKTYAIIGGAVAAAAIIIGVVAITGVFDNKMDMPTQITDQQTASNSEIVTFKEQPVGPPAEMIDMQNSQLYRLNTSCEMLYAMSASEYPNGEKLHSLSITGVVSKYQEDFGPWLETFADDQKLRAFIEQGFSPEFLDIFADKIILEYSINPELKPLVLMALDPKTQTIDINKIFEEDKCMEYYASRKGPQNTQP
ncbi:MAG: hypothetical protein Q8O65_05390 [Nitrosopumilaceae archaeon]|nr:hypothetical protein [Nitrosopumilaceae archaeon]